MRPSPPLRVCIRDHGAWRAGLVLVLLLVLLVQSAWLHGRAADLGRGVLLLLAALDFAVLAVAASAVHRPAVVLRWDTRRWWLAGVDAEEASAVAGRLSVAIDLGPWMLLAFHPEPAAGRPARPTWVPVQRRGLEAHWHALRCAVYCARPAPPGGAASDAGPEPQE